MEQTKETRTASNLFEQALEKDVIMNSIRDELNKVKDDLTAIGIKAVKRMCEIMVEQGGANVVKEDQFLVMLVTSITIPVMEESTTRILDELSHTWLQEALKFMLNEMMEEAGLNTRFPIQ